MIRACLTSFLLLVLGTPSWATHFPGGNITYTCLGANNYEVTFELYRECSGAAMIPQTLLFTSDCGTSFTINGLQPVSAVEVSQLCPAELPNSTCNGGPLPGIELNTFTTQVNLGNCAGWTISWQLCCRANSLNLQGTPGMYIEAHVDQANSLCNDSPIFTDQAVPYFCVNDPANYNYAVTDPEGDSLSYTFIDARITATSSAPYGPGFSGSQPYTGMVLDEVSGQISFTPTMTGYIFVVLQVNSFDSTGTLLGSVMSDLAFVVLNCQNTAPDETSGEVILTDGNATALDARTVQVCGGDSICMEMSISDPDTLQELVLTSTAATVLIGAQVTITGTNPATARICWNTSGVSAGTYNFVITAEDNACPNTAVQNFAYGVQVIGGALAGLDGTAAVCPNAVSFLLVDSLEGTPTAGGSWTGPNNLPMNGEYTLGTDVPGTYCYTVPGVGGCPDAVACVTVTELSMSDPECMSTGWNEAYQAGFTLAPNPTNGTLRLTLPETQVGKALTLDLIDALGASIVRHRVSDPGITVRWDLPSQVGTGTYFLRITNTEGGQWTVRSVVER